MIFARSRSRGGGLAVLLTATVIALLVAGGQSRGAGKRPVTVGYMVPLTGISAANGQNAARGFNLGLKVFGSTVAGHKIHVDYVDTQGDPAVAVTQARELVEHAHADVIEGPLVAAEVGPVTSYLGPTGIPTDDVQLCSPLQLDYYKRYDYAFASAWTCEQAALMGAVWAVKAKHWKKVAIVAQDFAFGWQNAGAFAAVFRKLGGTVASFIWIPPSASDYGPYVSQIPKGVDAVYTEMAGTASVRFTKAYSDFGLKGKVPLLGLTQLTDYSSLPAEDPNAVLGVYTDATYCDGIDSPLNNLFVKLYKQRYGVYPANSSEIGFTKARILVHALRKLRGDASSHKKLIETMKATAIVAPRGPVRLNREFWSPVQNVYICQVKRVAGELRNVPIFTYTDVEPWGPLTKDEWLAHFRHDAQGRPS